MAFGQKNTQESGFKPAYTHKGTVRDTVNPIYSPQVQASQFARDNGTYSKKTRKRRSKKPLVIAVCCVLVLCLAGAGVAAAMWYNNVNNELTHGTKSDDELNAISDELAKVSAKTFDEPFYMMLIGSDAREGDDEEGQRSDTNIVARVDPTTNTVTLISIPRDTMIEIDGYGTQKFNAAYSIDGAAGAIREAKELLGVEIEHYAEVDFNELEELVDAVGGVDVVVDERIDDPDADNWTKEDVHHVVVEAGEQHLNGEAALVFARSRDYVDGDFTRTKNQRKLIEALADKVLALPATDLPNVVQTAAKSVTTDLDMGDLVALAQQFQDNDTNLNAVKSANSSAGSSSGTTDTETATTSSDTSLTGSTSSASDTAAESTSSASTSSAADSTSSGSGNESALSGLTLYSAMLPSTTAYIGDVSYVINDPAATKEMMKLVEAGKDPSTVECTTDPATLIAEYYSEYSSSYSADGSGGGVDAGSYGTDATGSYGYDAAGSGYGASSYGYDATGGGYSDTSSNYSYDYSSTGSGSAYGTGTDSGSTYDYSAGSTGTDSYSGGYSDASGGTGYDYSSAGGSTYSAY